MSNFIDYNDIDSIAKDIWLFLTDEKMPKKASIKKKAFLHEVSIMLQAIKEHERVKHIKPSSTEVAARLFGIHHHLEESKKIYYLEEELLPILKLLGLPDPDRGALTVDIIQQYKEDQSNKSPAIS